MKFSLYLFIFINGILYGQSCPYDIVITTDNYATNLTQSSSFIIINSSTDVSKIVKLSASPNDGYIIMNPGFVSSPSYLGAFVAQIDECGGVDLIQKKMNQDWSSNFEAKIKIYPNPTHDFIYISFGKENDTDFMLFLFDSSGKLVINKIISAGKETYTFDISSLVSGSYTYKVESNNHFKSGIVFKK